MMHTSEVTSDSLPFEIDSVETSLEHRSIIRRKRFLQEIYREHYEYFRKESSTAPSRNMLELGSGGGFIREIIPHVTTSDIVALPDCSLVCSAQDLPFGDQSLGAIMMINVLHHIQDVSAFFSEASRCLLPTGRILMIEPAHTLFSSFIFRNFHHEPFQPEQIHWQLPSGGRMSSANDALPWIIFMRDRALFEKRFPQLRIDCTEAYMPFRYLLSGGVSKPQLLPSFMYGTLKRCEQVLAPLNNVLGMFMKIAVTRI